MGHVLMVMNKKGADLMTIIVSLIVVVVIAFITLLATEGEWKRIYLNLTNDIQSFSGSKFKLWFNAGHDSTLVKSQLLIDNLKIIYQ